VCITSAYIVIELTKYFCLNRYQKWQKLHSMRVLNIWKSHPIACSLVVTKSISSPLLSDAVKQISGYMGMQPCERSDKIESNKSSHTLLLAGVYRGGHDVLVRARLAKSEGVTMKITIRSDSLNACEVIAAAVG